MVDNGIKWRALPADFPPWPTVHKRVAAWDSRSTAGKRVVLAVVR
jgi:transposase